MNNRFIQYVLVLIATSFVTVGAEEDRFARVEINTQKVADGIYMLTGAGGNIGVSAGEDGVLMIDDQFAPLTGKILKAISNISERPIKFLLNTHWHFDHTGGNENLGKKGILIVAHDNVRKRMSVDTEIRALKTVVPASPKAALPVITFNDNVTFHFNGEEIKVMHFKRSHTDGDSVIHFKKANVIHTGDIWFHGAYPFIDVSTDGSVDGLIKSVEAITAMADDETKIIPGHGPLGDKKALKGYLEMLKTVRERMQKLIAEGKSLAQIIKLKPNADYDDEMGKGFVKPELFIRILHSSLKD